MSHFILLKSVLVKISTTCSATNSTSYSGTTPACGAVTTQPYLPLPLSDHNIISTTPTRFLPHIGSRTYSHGLVLALVLPHRLVMLQQLLPLPPVLPGRTNPTHPGHASISGYTFRTRVTTLRRSFSRGCGLFAVTIRSHTYQKMNIVQF